MIRHLVLFRFRDEVAATEIEDILAALETFPSRYPAMRNWSSGPNLSERDDTMTHGFMVEFDSTDELNDYLNSEEHERFVTERFRPIIERRIIFSFETRHTTGGVVTGALSSSTGGTMESPESQRPRAPFGMEYARIEVPDLASTISFLEYHVGLQLEEHDEQYAFLRADIEHHSVELLHRPELEEAQTTAIGFSVENDAVLDDLRRRVEAAGHEILELDKRVVGLVERGFAVRDPNGLIVELFTEFQEYAEPPLLEFRPLDLVHPFLVTDRFDDSLAFYRDLLGFLASDYIEDATAFLRSEDRYHHSLALSRSADGFHVAHLCFMMKSFDHVMRGRARAQYKEVHIASDLVNHSASTSIAFYLLERAHGPRYELCDDHRIFTAQEHETHRPRIMTADPRNIDVWRPAADDWSRF